GWLPLDGLACGVSRELEALRGWGAQGYHRCQRTFRKLIGRSTPWPAGATTRLRPARGERGTGGARVFSEILVSQARAARATRHGRSLPRYESLKWKQRGGRPRPPRPAGRFVGPPGAGAAVVSPFVLGARWILHSRRSGVLPWATKGEAGENPAGSRHCYRTTRPQ